MLAAIALTTALAGMQPGECLPRDALKLGPTEAITVLAGDEQEFYWIVTVDDDGQWRMLVVDGGEICFLDYGSKLVIVPVDDPDVVRPEN